jgi:large subunit ribosomal protein L25
LAPQQVEFDHNALFHALRNEAFHSSILSMKLDGSTTRVVLRDVQMHPFRNEILHVDFQRIEEDRPVRVRVPLHFINGEISPAVKLTGAIISHVITDVEITCLPKSLPEFIEIDLSELTTAHALHVSAIKLPEGVKVVKHGTLDPVVAAAVVPRAVVETEEETAAAAAPAAEGAAAPPAAEEAPPAEKKETTKEEKKGSGKEDRKK